MTSRVIVTKHNNGAFRIVAEDSDGRLFQATFTDRNTAMNEALQRLGAMFNRRFKERRTGTTGERRGIKSLL